MTPGTEVKDMQLCCVLPAPGGEAGLALGFKLGGMGEAEKSVEWQGPHCVRPCVLQEGMTPGRAEAAVSLEQGVYE